MTQVPHLWNCFAEIKEISVYNEHRPQGIAYLLYNTFFSLIYMPLFKHTSMYVQCITAFLNRKSIYGSQVQKFTFLLCIIYHPSFMYVCTGVCICMFECVGPYLTSRHNALIINIQCSGTSCRAKKTKSMIAMTETLLSVSRSLHTKKGVSEEFKINSFGTLMISYA